MPITFSEKFNVDEKKLDELCLFDVILDVDTRVFIDPALLELCNVPEFVGAKATVEKYFSNIITLLSHSKRKKDQFWQAANRLLTFRELEGTCFGYSQEGTSGNAIGPVLRESILSTTKELLNEGMTDPVLFELLGVFQENVGCDRISDLITFILRKNILEYTQRVVEECEVPSIIVNLGTNKYKSCRNPYNRKPLLLLPSTILSPLPVAESFDDIDWICLENQRVRDEINAYFDLGNRKKLHKSEVLSLMLHSDMFRTSLVDAYKATPKKAYDFSIDPSGEYIWYSAAKQYTEKFPLELDKVSSTDDVLTVVNKICEQFKALIEDNDLSELLYNPDGSSKHESAAQLLFYGIADSYCNANDIDLTREGNNGRGPVDFKLSRGMSDKVVVEVKLTSNSQLKHGIERQLPIYMKQEKTKKAIYLIIDNGYQKALDNFLNFYNDLKVEEKEKIPYVIIDGTKKPSASKS